MSHDDASHTTPAEHTTAAAMGKTYKHAFEVSPEQDGSSFRACDGCISSGQYLQQATRDATVPDPLRLDFHHPLEDWLARRPVRWLLRWLTREGRDGQTALDRILASYRNPNAPRWHRVKYALVHRLIDRVKGKTPPEVFREKIAENTSTVRGMILAGRSVAKFGLSTPQKFIMPLFAVWSFTNRCNLKCQHCYQDSEHAPLADELTLDEKLALMDQMGQASMPMIAFSGGEPTIHPDLLPVIRRAKEYGMHVSIATNGTAITESFAAELADAGARYIEISLDSVDPARHDAFRGVPGMWDKAIAGARAVAATEGLRLGIATCVHQGNIDELEAMIEFAEHDLGASCFAHFNFIPVGRGLNMIADDITPAQREKMLAILQAKMEAGGMGVISTAPQLGRVCLAGALGDEGQMTCSHAGSGSGIKARVVAKYLGGCGAGRTYVCVEPNGDVTPCVYLPHRIMGNVREKSLAEIFQQSVFWDVLNDRDRRLHHCGVCEFKAYCGGCRARADAYFGQLHAGDPGCIFNSKHWDALVNQGDEGQG
jgi:radical SAM protein with 4Fe4S-binding SPASM domain